MFSDVLRMLSGAHICSIDVFRCVQNVVRCSQIFSDVPRIFLGCSWDVFRTFHDVLRMFPQYLKGTLVGLAGLVGLSVLAGSVGLVGLMGPKSLRQYLYLRWSCLLSLCC